MRFCQSKYKTLWMQGFRRCTKKDKIKKKLDMERYQKCECKKTQITETISKSQYFRSKIKQERGKQKKFSVRLFHGKN